MDIKEIKVKSKEELNKLLSDNRDKLRDLKFKVANRQLKDVRGIRKLKREIARMLTVLNNKETK
jgi:large subunit ribosomal protein L29